MAYEGSVLHPRAVLHRPVVHNPVRRFRAEAKLVRTISNLRAGLRWNFSATQVPHGDVLKEKRELTPAALYELFTRHSQCVFDQSGKCPLLVFSEQMCWEINEFFTGEKSEDTCRRERRRPASMAPEEFE
jgi:hypothetical protein